VLRYMFLKKREMKVKVTEKRQKGVRSVLPVGMLCVLHM
jgi:hypothetical protein